MYNKGLFFFLCICKFIPFSFCVEEHNSEYFDRARLTYSLFGGSHIDRDKFAGVLEKKEVPHLNKGYFLNLKMDREAEKAVSERFTRDELKKSMLSFYWKKHDNPREVTVLFSYPLVLEDPFIPYEHIELVKRFFPLMEDRAGLGLQRVTILTLLWTRRELSQLLSAGHYQLLTIECFKPEEEDFSFKMKITDSRTEEKEFSNIECEKIKKTWENQGFRVKVGSEALGIQRVTNWDCGVYAAALLYLRWKTNTNPEDIKIPLLYETMQIMIHQGVMKKKGTYGNKPVDWIEKVFLKIGTFHRSALEDINQPLLTRYYKLCMYEAGAIALEQLYTLVSKGIRFFQGVSSKRNNASLNQK